MCHTDASLLPLFIQYVESEVYLGILPWVTT